MALSAKGLLEGKNDKNAVALAPDRAKDPVDKLQYHEVLAHLLAKQ